MRVYISVDMEGVAGVVHVDQTRRGTGTDFGTGRELMTMEANAAALGAFDAGAKDVLINDSHGDMRNLVFDKLDPRVQVITGSLKPFSMVEGIHDGRYDIAMFIGYHASAGSRAAILDHTYWGAVVSCMKVNGRVMNEASLNALVAGEAGTPVGLVAGDETCCIECKKLLGNVETVTVKWAIGRYSARSMHPEEARKVIRAGAAKAVKNVSRYKPFRMPAPYELEIKTHNAGMADSAGVMPGVKRVDGTTIRYKSANVRELFGAMLALIRLAGEGVV
ncbi:MAG TPA: M55 family metallopeptidase [Planctomycetota bacterium]|nr:M55 family metallopeptidase [Planctomycetota bacterium]